ncbi:MAG: creatininase family protein [Armatimonadota bacterium]
MKLAHLTWPEIRELSRDTLVVIPTGSIEQHGPHLPLVTDTMLATAVAEGAERNVSDWMLLTPTLWLGASLHHLPFPGTLSASFEGYEKALWDVMESLAGHGFHRFYLVNGHGGNTSINNVTLRKWKHQHPSHTIGHIDYYDLIPDEVLETHVKGPAKSIHHACEIETSLMLHVAPELVRMDEVRNDGLRAEEPVRGIIWNYDEVTEDGPWGYSALGTAELGKICFEAAVEKLTDLLVAIATGFSLVGIEEFDVEPTR